MLSVLSVIEGVRRDEMEGRWTTAEISAALFGARPKSFTRVTNAVLYLARGTM